MRPQAVAKSAFLTVNFSPKIRHLAMAIRGSGASNFEASAVFVLDTTNSDDNNIHCFTTQKNAVSLERRAKLVSSPCIGLHVVDTVFLGQK